MNELIILKSKSLLNLAKSIFGDIVVNAYLVENNYDNLYKEERENLRYTLRKFADSERVFFQQDAKNQQIEYDGLQIALEFINGKKVLFSNSEWAVIEPLINYDESKAEIIYE